MNRKSLAALAITASMLGIGSQQSIDAQSNLPADPTPINIVLSPDAIIIPHNQYPSINYAFNNPEIRSFIHNSVKLFHPEMSDAQIEAFIDQIPIITSDEITYDIEHNRGGSWGSTMMEVSGDGTVQFSSISFGKDHLSNVTQSLVAEEFLQSLQYNAVAAGLYNNGYLNEVAGIQTPEQLYSEITYGNFRAFLEIIQQAYKEEHGINGNSYDYYIQGVGTNLTVDQAFQILSNLASDILTGGKVKYTPEDFMNPEFIIQLNNAFRDVFIGLYRRRDPNLTVPDIQFWNLFGMNRPTTLSIIPRFEVENFVPFHIGSINFGTIGIEKGPLTELVIEKPAQVWNRNEFDLLIYPRQMNPTDNFLAGDPFAQDNPVWMQYNGVLVQTIHSGYLANGSQFPADPLRADVEETGSQLAWTNVTSAEGKIRRDYYKDAPFTITQNGNTEHGKLIGLFYISPQQTQALNQAFIDEAAGLRGPVDILEFSDYDGPPLDPVRDLLGFYCAEPYADEPVDPNIAPLLQARMVPIFEFDIGNNQAILSTPEATQEN